MPRRKSSNPAYCLQKPDRAFVTIDGKRFYLGIFGSQESRDAYDRLIGEWIGLDRAKTPPAPKLLDRRRRDPAADEVSQTITVGEVVERFIRHGREYYATTTPEGKRPSGELGNYFDAVLPLLRLHHRTPAIDFGPMALKAVRESMIETGWCRKVVNRQINRIQAIFRWAVSCEIIPGEIVVKLDTGQRSPRGPHQGPREQARASGVRGVRGNDPALPVRACAVDGPPGAQDRHEAGRAV